MRGAVLATAVLLAAAFLAGPALGGAAPAPAPGELWSKFPLEPRTEPTEPTAETPRPVRPEPQATTRAPKPQATTRAPNPQVTTRGNESRDALPAIWVVLGIAVAATAMVMTLAHGRRPSPPPAPAKKRQQKPAVPTITPPKRQATPRTARNGRSLSATVAPAKVAPARVAAPRTDPAPVEVLSPRVRVDERPAEHESGREASGLEVCEIRCWHGYVHSIFYAAADPPAGRPTQSRPFRARGGVLPEQNAAAVAAHEGLIEALLADGWEPEGRGARWFSDRFRRS
jgi:hypothetical protein